MQQSRWAGLTRMWTDGVIHHGCNPLILLSERRCTTIPDPRARAGEATRRWQPEGQGSISISKHHNHGLQRAFRPINIRWAQLLQLLPYRDGWPARLHACKALDLRQLTSQMKPTTYLRLTRQGVYQKAHETGAAEISGGISACWLISDPVESHLENSGLRQRLTWRSWCSSVSVLPHAEGLFCMCVASRYRGSTPVWCWLFTVCTLSLLVPVTQPDMLPPAAPGYLCYWGCCFKSSYRYSCWAGAPLITLHKLDIFDKLNYTQSYATMYHLRRRKLD